jgi:hypothetical protein
MPLGRFKNNKTGWNLMEHDNNWAIKIYKTHTIKKLGNRLHIKAEKITYD